jgi:hypothetical protein
MELNELQKTRQSNYGSFGDQAKIVDRVISLLRERNIQVNGELNFPEGFETALFYMVTKLVRLSASPTHDDSALDLSSYANLWYKEITK